MKTVAHRHRGRLGKQFGKGTLMDRIEMLDQDEAHACVDWQMLKQLCECF